MRSGIQPQAMDHRHRPAGRDASSPQAPWGWLGVLKPWPLAGALIALATYAVLQRHGIKLTEDGWAYWQSAISLTEGAGFRYFSGNPIIAWPPLYSLYLAGWSIVLGPHALALIVGNGVLITAQAYLWIMLAFILAGDRNSWLLNACIAVWLGLFVPLTQMSVLAHNLNLALLSAFLICVWQLVERPRIERGVFTLTVLLAVTMMLTHNSSIIFLGTAGVVIAWLPTWPMRLRLSAGSALIAAGLLASLGTRLFLGQSGSHPPVGGRYSVPETIIQALQGLGLMLGPALFWPITVSLFVIAFAVVARNSRRDQDRFVIAFCLFPLLALISLFSVIWLNGTISEHRHLLFIPLLACPYIILNGHRLGAILLSLAVAFLLSMQTYRAVNWAFVINRTNLIPAVAKLSRVNSQGSVIRIGDQFLVGPIDWEEPTGGYSRNGTPQWNASQAALKDRYGGVLTP